MAEATSENQILLGNNLEYYSKYCTNIAYCLEAIIGNKLKVDHSIYEVLQILTISLPDKAPIREILTKCGHKDTKEFNCKQLKISGF